MSSRNSKSESCACVNKMLGILRIPYTVCCRVCVAWRKNVYVGILMLCLVLISFFMFHSFHSNSTKISKSTVERVRDKLPSVDTHAPYIKLPVLKSIKDSAKAPGKLGSSSVSQGQKPPSKRKNGTAQCDPLNEDIPRGPIDADIDTVPSFEDLTESLSEQLHLGGHYIPTDCRPTQRVAVIVPYRDRSIHLKMFLQHMHPFLQRQQMEYYIVVVEQAEGEPFNRALLFNIGFYKMNKLHDIDCYIFQDVDLLPLDDRIMYRCQEQPLHLSMLVDTLGDKLMYENLFGGVVALTPGMMATVNGFSNLYYGWGGEDDDMSYRIRSHGYSIDRYSKEVARFTMMKHAQEEDVNQDKLNRKVQAGRGRIHEDGLNTLVFHLLDFQPLPLYTWMHIKPNRSLSWEDFEVN